MQVRISCVVDEAEKIVIPALVPLRLPPLLENAILVGFLVFQDRISHRPDLGDTRTENLCEGHRIPDTSRIPLQPRCSRDDLHIRGRGCGHQELQTLNSGARVPQFYNRAVKHWGILVDTLEQKTAE